MTNNLKEIERIITWRERLVLDDNDSAYRRLLAIANAEKEAVREMSNLINQKEKELLEKFEEAIGEDQSIDLDNISVEDWHAYNDGLEKEYQAKNQLRSELRDRIKQLKEELKGGEQ